MGVMRIKNVIENVKRQHINSLHKTGYDNHINEDQENNEEMNE